MHAQALTHTQTHAFTSVNTHTNTHTPQTHINLVHTNTYTPKHPNNELIGIPFGINLGPEFANLFCTFMNSFPCRTTLTAITTPSEEYNTVKYTIFNLLDVVRL